MRDFQTYEYIQAARQTCLHNHQHRHTPEKYFVENILLMTCEKYHRSPPDEIETK